MSIGASPNALPTCCEVAMPKSSSVMGEADAGRLRAICAGSASRAVPDEVAPPDMLRRCSRLRCSCLLCRNCFAAQQACRCLLKFGLPSASWVTPHAHGIAVLGLTLAEGATPGGNAAPISSLESLPSQSWCQLTLRLHGEAAAAGQRQHERAGAATSLLRLAVNLDSAVIVRLHLQCDFPSLFLCSGSMHKYIDRHCRSAAIECLMVGLSLGWLARHNGCAPSG